MKIGPYMRLHEKDAVRDSFSIKRAIDDYLESEGLYLQILDEDEALVARECLVKTLLKEE